MRSSWRSGRHKPQAFGQLATDSSVNSTTRETAEQLPETIMEVERTNWNEGICHGLPTSVLLFVGGSVPVGVMS